MSPKRLAFVGITMLTGLGGLGLAWRLGALVPGVVEPGLGSGALTRPRVTPADAGWPLEFRTLDWSPRGPYRDPVRALIRSESEWKALNARARPVGEPSLPAVDWSRNVLVLVSGEAAGPESPSLEVTGVRQEGADLVIDLAIGSGASEERGVLGGAPYHLIEVPAVDVERLVVHEVRADAPPADEGPRSTTWGALKAKYRGSGS